MSDPRYRHVERHSRSSAFWGIILVFVVAMLAMVAYGYHGIHSIQTPSSGTPEATSGQSTKEAPDRVPTPPPEPR
jgi:hypothetical protein